MEAPGLDAPPDKSVLAILDGKEVVLRKEYSLTRAEADSFIKHLDLNLSLQDRFATTDTRVIFYFESNPIYEYVYKTGIAPNVVGYVYTSLFDYLHALVNPQVNIEDIFEFKRARLQSNQLLMTESEACYSGACSTSGGGTSTGIYCSAESGMFCQSCWMGFACADGSCGYSCLHWSSCVSSCVGEG